MYVGTVEAKLELPRADSTPPSSAKFKHLWIITTMVPYTFVLACILTPLALKVTTSDALAFFAGNAQNESIM
jgi:hypothetical protein